MFSRKFVYFQLFVLLILLGFGSFVWWGNQEPLPVIGQIENVSLIDQNADNFSFKNLDGKVWVADFIFTTCSGICPMMTKQLKRIAKHFENNPHFKVVSISVNPENDTPMRLNDYAKENDLNADQWFLLTGSREDITKLSVNSFKLGDKNEMAFHSSYFVLIDKKGNIRGYYDSNESKRLTVLDRDIRKLLKEK